MLCSASPSLRGGAQGLLQLRVPLDALGMFVHPRLFALSLAGKALDAQGRLTDARLHEELDDLAERFIRYSASLAIKKPEGS